MDRLFVAVWPPASVLDCLRSWPRPDRPGLRWTTEDQWHVTLRFAGDVDEVGREALRHALGLVATGAAPVAVRAGPAPRALGRAVWVLPVEGLESLAGAIGDATSDVGQPPPDRPFRGHLTLARARRPASLDGLPAPPLSDAWSVTEITLVRSELRAVGARYDIVDTWSLQAGCP
jgi:RNA 2',3'-cyclic 3'-phosphodiesterase